MMKHLFKRRSRILLAATICLAGWMVSARGQAAPPAPLAPTASDASTLESTNNERTITERVTTVRETETKVTTRQEADAKPLVAAIFVKNRAREVPDAKVSVLEDFVVSKITDRGFKVISREDAINSVKDFAAAGPNRGDDAGPGARLDQILSNNTSAMRLAQNLGADYILVASIASCTSGVTDFDGYGVKTSVRETKLNVAYKLLDAGDGGSLTGDVVEVTRKDRATANHKSTDPAIDAMLKQSAGDLANVLGKRAEAHRIPPADGKLLMAEFNVACGISDLTIPEVVKDEKGEYTITANRYRVDALAATVALDGVVVGTTPGPLRAYRGLHKMRISRAGFKDWEQTVNVQPGQTLIVALQLDDEGYRRWHENTQFLNGLKVNSKMTDAQAKAWEGLAEMLKKSGFRINIGTDGTLQIAPTPPAHPG